MPAPAPPVGLKSQCSVIFDNVLYIYSPDAFQSIELKEDAEWEEHSNGVAVTGAQCVLGGVDGDNRKRALYVVGGTANATNADFSGLQRFTFDDKRWSTIKPVVTVTKDRLRHGANYIPSTNAIVIYGGSSVPGYEGASSETFSIDLKEPYNVQAYDSTAPPTSRPFVMPWGDDSVVMVGGSDTNKKVFTFTTSGGWAEFAVELPNALPDASVAQAAMYTLQDGSKILQVFQLGQDPIEVTTNVLLNPGSVPGVYGQTVGTPPASVAMQSPPAAGLARRQSLNDYPAYNSSSVPDTTRSDFSIAQGSEGLLALVGGNEDEPVTFFNQAGNSWVSPQAVLGEAQEPLQPSSTSSTPTSSTSPTATASESSVEAAPAADSGNNSRTFEILGGVLGGICGLVAILIILLLFIRNKKRKQRREANGNRKSYPAGKKASTDLDFEEGMHPLREHGQPMGRSPVNSQVLERSSTAMFTRRPNDSLTRRISSDNRMQPETQQHKSTSAAYSIFAREKSPLGKSPMAISKPMNPYLGDYTERPSIDLGRATPASPVNATPLATIPAASVSRSKSNRKTDEAWGKYFTGTDPTPAAPVPRPTTSRGAAGGAVGGGGGGFWPGSGHAPKSPSNKFAFRDSAGNTLQTRSVGTASPALENPPPSQHYLGLAQPKAGRISNANSMSSDGSSAYEDDTVDPAFSSGVPASVQGEQQWHASGSGWSAAQKSHLRSFSQRQNEYLPPPTAQTASSGETSQGTMSSGGIPNFPMPSGASARPPVSYSTVQHPAATHRREVSSGYFPPVGAQQQGGHKREISNDEEGRFSIDNAKVRPDMLYQYLLDEVGRKQVKVVKRRKEEGVGAGGNGKGIALEELSPVKPGLAAQAWPKRAVGVGGSLGMGGVGNNGTGLDLGAGEPVGGKSTGLPMSGEVELLGEFDFEYEQDHEVPMISRSRSEKHKSGGPRKSRGKLLRRILTGQEKGDVVVAVGGDAFSDDGSMPATPQVPAFAARVPGETELVRTRGGEKRLTM